MITTEPAQAGTRRETLESYVRSRAVGLHKRLSAGDSSARASLARMRRAVGADIAVQPEAWGEVYAGFPEELVGEGDDVGPYEYAAHIALTLFALHQQSQAQPMHVGGPSARLGSAVRKLATPNDAQEHEQATLRRFQALVTADELPEIVHHLRGIVLFLKAKSIPLDYGRLASDVASLHSPEGATRVKLRWARDLYTAPRSRPNAHQPPSKN